MISEHVGGLVGCGDGVVWVGFGEVVVPGFLLVVGVVLGDVLLVEEHGTGHKTQHDDRHTEHQQHRVTTTKNITNLDIFSFSFNFSPNICKIPLIRIWKVLHV